MLRASNPPISSCVFLGVITLCFVVPPVPVDPTRQRRTEKKRSTDHRRENRPDYPG
jgi:hypothetical protein